MIEYRASVWRRAPRPVVTALIPLPVRYNADRQGRRRPIPDSVFDKTAAEIAAALREGGMLYRFRNERPHGFWWDRGVVDQDVLALLEVDFPDAPRHRRWLETYVRGVLLRRFRQKAIYIRYVGPIERLVVSGKAIHR